MRIIDISWPITQDMTEYKDSGSVQLIQKKNVSKDGVAAWHLSLANHTGTHVDGPAHFVQDGKTLDALSLNHFIGPCQVVDMVHVEQQITDQDLEKTEIIDGSRVLLKTKNSLLKHDALFNYSFITLTADAAKLLVARNVSAIGFDYLGIEINQPGHPTHQALLQHEIPIIEGLRLAHVDSGDYFLCCLPLHIPGMDSAPARAVLIDPQHV